MYSTVGFRLGWEYRSIQQVSHPCVVSVPKKQWHLFRCHLPVMLNCHCVPCQPNLTLKERCSHPVHPKCGQRYAVLRWQWQSLPTLPISKYTSSLYFVFCPECWMLIPNFTVSFSFNLVQRQFVGLYLKTVLAWLIYLLI